MGPKKAVPEKKTRASSRGKSAPKRTDEKEEKKEQAKMTRSRSKSGTPAGKKTPSAGAKSPEPKAPRPTMAAAKASVRSKKKEEPEPKKDVKAKQIKASEPVEPKSPLTLKDMKNKKASEVMPFLQKSKSLPRGMKAEVQQAVKSPIKAESVSPVHKTPTLVKQEDPVEKPEVRLAPPKSLFSVPKKEHVKQEGVISPRSDVKMHPSSPRF